MHPASPAAPVGAEPSSPAADGADAASADDVLCARVPPQAAGERLDKVLAQLFPAFSRSRLKVWCEAGRVRSGGDAATPRLKARAGALIELRVPVDAEAASFAPEPIALQVVWSDADLAVIDKPPGMVVHPAAGNWSGTLLNGLLARFPPCAALPRAGIVHRLDKDTSGLLVVALTLVAQTDLVRQLQARSVSRQYLALAWGALPEARSVDAPIGRHPRDRLRMAVVASGKPAQTLFEPLATVSTAFGPVTALRCRLRTGRTHQIRVHAQHLGLPLLGDALYGRRGLPGGDARAADAAQRRAVEALGRQALHAAALRFVHPRTGEAQGFVSPVTADVRTLWLALGGDAAVLDVAGWSGG